MTDKAEKFNAEKQEMVEQIAKLREYNTLVSVFNIFLSSNSVLILHNMYICIQLTMKVALCVLFSNVMSLILLFTTCYAMAVAVARKKWYRTLCQLLHTPVTISNRRI